MKSPADRIKEIQAELRELESRRQGLLAEMRDIRSGKSGKKGVSPSLFSIVQTYLPNLGPIPHIYSENDFLKAGFVLKS